MDSTQEDKKRIAVIDDTPENIKVIGTILREAGYLVSVAQSGEQALKMFETSLPDLVLLDIMMPNMDGYETCSCLKKNPLMSEIPVIFMSALTETVDKIKGFDVGAVDYVTKPIETEELLARISTHIKIKSLQEELEVMNRNLEKKVQLRTADLEKTNQKLVQEIIQRKQLEEKLRKFEFMSNTSKDFMSMIGHDMCYIAVNNAFEEAFRKEGECLVGMPVDKLWVNEDYEKNIKPALEKCFLGKTVRYEKSYFFGKLGERYMDIIYYPYFDDNGIVTNVVTVSHDITPLKDSEKKIRIAHEAGMADIASDTLHNVGNGLNSVKVSAQIIKELNSERTKNNEDLNKAIEMLKGNLDNIENFITYDDKGKKLLQYLIVVNEALINKSDTIDDLIQRLLNNIQIVERVITAQQKYANLASLAEPHSLIDIIDDVIKLKSSQMECNHIKISKSYQSVPKITLQKSKLVYILLNLINNASDAMLDTSLDQRNLQFILSQNEQFVFLKISDNGLGIPEENLNKIFTHGFTTKKDGHGFGLHSSANYVAEMGGKIWAESHGEGKGATIVLQFKTMSANDSYKLLQG